jgi:hypothetical protein
MRIIIDLREIGWGGMDRFDLAEDRNRWRMLMNRARTVVFYVVSAATVAI